MKNDRKLSCVDCSISACKGNGKEYPDFCTASQLPSKLREESKNLLMGKENAIAVASALTETEGYCVRCRIEEIMHLAKLMKIQRLGIATCAGLLSESRQLARVLRTQGYEVFGVACKCGSIAKTDIGAPEKCTERGPFVCNPILQAFALNHEKTELNIVMGLCVGHDSLFYKYSEAYTTTLVAKDRLLGHNPAAPLYQLDGYWRKLLKQDSFLMPDFF